jgi:hypothetical protein
MSGDARMPPPLLGDRALRARLELLVPMAVADQVA